MNSPHDVKNCRKCHYLRVLAIVFWTSGLVVLSLLPSVDINYYIAWQDKAFHFLAYLLTAWLACRFLQLFSFSVASSVIISMIYSVVLGGLLEYLQQAATRTRTAEWLDLLANIIGAACGCAVFCLHEKIKSRNDKTLG